MAAFNQEGDQGKQATQANRVHSRCATKAARAKEIVALYAQEHVTTIGRGVSAFRNIGH
jgi:hypothetical protein